MESPRLRLGFRPSSREAAPALVLFRKRQGKEGIMRQFFGHGGKRAMTGTKQGVRGQAQNLFPYFLAQQLGGLKSAPHGTGEDGIAHHRDQRGVIGKAAYDISDPILTMARSFAVSDAQAADGNAIIGPVPLFRGGVAGAGMQADLGTLVFDGIDGRDVIVMMMRNK